MKRFIFFALLAFFTVRNYAQIHITPVVSSSVEGFTDNEKNIFENRLSSILSQNNMLSKIGDSRFVLVGKIDTESKDVLGTAPTQIAYKLNVTLAVGDGFEGIKFAVETLTAKGVGSTEEKAVLNAIKNINGKSEMIANLMNTGRLRIIDYYNSNFQNIIAKARLLVNNDKFDEAMYSLVVFPEECEGYQQSLDLINEIYMMLLDRQAKEVLKEAQALWAGNPSEENTPKVMEILSQIDSKSNVYSDAQKLMEKIQSSITTKREREYQDAKAQRDREYNDAIALRNKQIDTHAELTKAGYAAAVKIAKAYSKQKKVKYKIYNIL